jgi:enoyl-CoA hydratase/carnithine racemase
MPEPGSPVASDPSTLGYGRIRYERDSTAGVATVTIDRPEVLNALDLPTLKELSSAFEQASWDEAVAVVVVTGAGDRAFCTGADLDEQALMGHTSGEYWRWMGAFIEMHDRLRHIGKPTIARINGACVGGGNELQIACDLSVIVDDGYIRHVGPEHGSVPAGGATQWLPIMIGDRRAREMILLCDEVPAAQAAEWGLINRAVPAGELDAAVDEWVEKLARKLPETTRYAKQQLNWWRDVSWHETVGHARDWLALSMLGDEAQGAIRSFLDRSK